MADARAAAFPPAAAGLEALSCGCSKVAGMFRKLHWLGGQMITKARPRTPLTGIVPPPGSPMWPRESSEILRWSPMTHRRPAGTVMLNFVADGTLPG